MRSNCLGLESTAIVYFVFFSLVFINFYSTSTGVMAATVKANRYCGANLVDALAFVCNGRYNFRKRFDVDLSQNMRGNEEFLHDNLETLRGLMTASASSSHEMNPVTFLVKRAALMRVARGVYSECCEQRCSYGQLLSYCAPSELTSRPTHRSTSIGGPSTQRSSDAELQLVANEY